MLRIQSIAIGSIAVGLVVLALKYAAYELTGSVALLSDAIESVVNVATAVVTLLAIRFSARPANTKYPYGHHKAEYMSAVFEGVLIVIAALSILRQAYSAYLVPTVIDAPWSGLALNGLASLVNAGWCFILIRRGRHEKSPALVADGYHLLADVLSSVGVIAGLALAAVTGFAILDPALAALVALNVLWSGWKLMRESVGGLLDEAVPPAQLERLRAIIAANADGAIEAHDLRTRRAGRMTFVEFHLVVKGSMSVTAAHDICDALERAIKEEVSDALISIHVEPDDKAKHSGIVVL